MLICVILAELIVYKYLYIPERAAFLLAAGSRS